MQVRDMTRRASAYLMSSRGRRARAVVTTSLILAAPAITRLRVVRSTVVGRLLIVAGGAALIVKAAEALRDWEPVMEWDAERT